LTRVISTPDYVWDNCPRARWHRGHDDPLLGWRQHTTASKFEPFPVGHT